MAEGSKKVFRRQREWPVILQVAKEYKLDPQQTLMLLGMRDAENGPPGFEYGVKPAKGTNLATQAQWAAGSIKANTERYNRLKQVGGYQGSRRYVSHFESGLPEGKVGLVSPDIGFIEFMGSYGGPTGYGWAPIHSPEMGEKERELNKNWVSNVRKITEKLQKEFKEKGAYNVEY